MPPLVFTHNPEHRMRFTKIKLSEKKGVHLEWTTPAEKSDKATVEHKLVSEEAPAPEFRAALDAFVPEVLDLLELPDYYEKGMTIIGLSVNYEADDRLGLVVTCLKALERTNAPLVLNTPHLREASDDEAGEYLPDQMLRLLTDAERHATAYVHGARAQMDMFAGAGA